VDQNILWYRYILEPSNLLYFSIKESHFTPPAPKVKVVISPPIKQLLHLPRLYSESYWFSLFTQYLFTFCQGHGWWVDGRWWVTNEAGSEAVILSPDILLYNNISKNQRLSIFEVVGRRHFPCEYSRPGFSTLFFPAIWYLLTFFTSLLSYFDPAILPCPLTCRIFSDFPLPPSTTFPLPSELLLTIL